jgi:hypothetical protein
MNRPLKDFFFDGGNAVSSAIEKRRSVDKLAAIKDLSKLSSHQEVTMAINPLLTTHHLPAPPS